MTSDGPPSYCNSALAARLSAASTDFKAESDNALDYCDTTGSAEAEKLLVGADDFAWTYEVHPRTILTGCVPAWQCFEVALAGLPASVVVCAPAVPTGQGGCLRGGKPWSSASHQ